MERRATLPGQPCYDSTEAAPLELIPFGDQGWLVRFETETGAARWTAAARIALRDEPDVAEVVLAYRSAAVFVRSQILEWDRLEQKLWRIVPNSLEAQPRGPLVEIPVLYNGPDLSEVARRLGLDEDRVIAAHCSTEYTLFAIGFLPGFPYLGYLPESLSGMARLDMPRSLVPAGTVAIAGRQTGIYPQDAPGGWHLLGRTPLVIADLRDGFFPLYAGDRVRFVPIDEAAFEHARGRRLEVAARTPDPRLLS